MGDKDGAAGAAEGTSIGAQPITITLDLNRVRSIIRAFQNDDEIGPMMALVGLNIGNSPRLEQPLEEIPATSITAILNNIDTFTAAAGKVLFQKDHLVQIDEFSNTRKYKNAVIFQQQVIFSFYKLVQQLTKTNPRNMEFEEVRNYLSRLIGVEVFAEKLTIILGCNPPPTPKK
jgi:hypothetical protein